eukprot:gene17014-23384_t
MPKWSEQETEEISIVSLFISASEPTIRANCANLIAQSAPYPEVIGDRKIVRFLRGHNHNIEKVTEMMNKFLTWRKENNVDEIRRSIIEDKLDHPLKFPMGEYILSLVPQLVICPNAMDKMGSPICVDQYNFSPTEVLTKVKLSDYIIYTIYCLEYKSIIVEQLSEEREKAFLDSLSEEELILSNMPNSPIPPYGVLVNTCVIRDLGSVGWDHLGTSGQEIIKAVVSIASDNYPELMRKCFMIKSPWIFNTIWYVIKGWLATRTQEKISIIGYTFLEEITKEVDIDSLP